MRAIIALAFLVFAPAAVAQPLTLTCENATVTVTYGTKGPFGYETVTLSVNNANTSIKKQYEFVWFHIACLANPTGKKFVVYQAYCGGSGCQDLDNWGIIDPVSLKALLEPSDGNHKKAESIFGAPLKPLFMSR